MKKLRAKQVFALVILAALGPWLFAGVALPMHRGLGSTGSRTWGVASFWIWTALMAMCWLAACVATARALQKASTGAAGHPWWAVTLWGLVGGLYGFGCCCCSASLPAVSAVSVCWCFLPLLRMSNLVLAGSAAAMTGSLAFAVLDGEMARARPAAARRQHA